uniref:Uncharacterized protein n=1 Tax=Molossus molossus TaxID=27622 RepID=A0A7J8G039_MOLMO|nr:hypothetical protein HJG59_008290 [Molossus molossus]
MTYWGTNLSMLFFCLKQLGGLPTYGINPKGPLYCANPLMIGPLASIAASSRISPRHPGDTSLFLTSSRGFILPCLGPYLGFHLVHPNPHVLPENYSFFRSSSSRTISQKPVATRSSGTERPLLCEAIVLLPSSARAMVCVLDPLPYCHFPEAGIGSYFCINST